MIAKSFQIVGTSAALSIAASVNPSAARFECKWVQLTVPDTNTNAVLVGGAEVTSTVGYKIPKGWSGQFLPAISEHSSRYDLQQIFTYVQTGDVINVLIGID